MHRPARHLHCFRHRHRHPSGLNNSYDSVGAQRQHDNSCCYATGPARKPRIPGCERLKLNVGLFSRWFQAQHHSRQTNLPRIATSSQGPKLMMMMIITILMTRDRTVTADGLKHCRRTELVLLPLYQVPLCPTDENKGRRRSVPATSAMAVHSGQVGAGGAMF